MGNFRVAPQNINYRCFQSFLRLCTALPSPLPTVLPLPHPGEGSKIQEAKHVLFPRARWKGVQ